MTARPKILIVEDEGIVALNLQHRLQHMGYDVAGVADSGAQSLSLMASQLPDLVLMDIHIKGEMDGIEVARRIGLDHTTPVVYLTAYSEDATLERARHTRPYGYLIKPFSERELHATIQMALERHSVQTALTESQRVLSQALGAASMGMVEVDRDARTVSVTGAPARMLGFAECGTMTLSQFLDRLVDEDRETLREELMVCDRQGKAVNQVFRVQLPDGRLRWLQLDAAGLSTQRISGVARDVTEREEARVGLERLNIELEERVEARTAELRQHVRELEAFSQTAAHDLRSPIRAISGLSHILSETKAEALGEDGREMLQRMGDAAVRMGQLIDALLSLSKLTRAQLHPGDVDLSQIARQIAQFLREAEPSRAAAIEVQDDLHAHADPALMRSVIDNLLRNAWKFSARRERTEIAVGQALHEGQPAFFVRDNGCGFDNAQARRLFDPFYRLHSEAEFSGSGLGLSIVQRIVARHGGRVWAQGSPGEGATFWFTLGA